MFHFTTKTAGRIVPAWVAVASPHHLRRLATNHALFVADSAPFPLPRERPKPPSNPSRRVRAAKSHRARCARYRRPLLLPFACWDPAHCALFTVCSTRRPIKPPSPTSNTSFSFLYLPTIDTL
ncbi:hypothetical protein PMIN03_007017 [Paraphaeosphaeria minitans]